MGRGWLRALTHFSRAVWGSFGYQGATGAHSVVFCSWAHWPPEHSQSRHNELLMTLWVTGRERASAHTTQWRTYASVPCLMSMRIHTLTDTHIRQTLNHTYKCILTRSSGVEEFWGRRTSRLFAPILFVILMTFCMILTWTNTALNCRFRRLKNSVHGSLKFCKCVRTMKVAGIWGYLINWVLPMACFPIAHWYVFLGDWLWWG